MKTERKLKNMDGFHEENVIFAGLTMLTALPRTVAITNKALTTKVLAPLYFLFVRLTCCRSFGWFPKFSPHHTDSALTIRKWYGNFSPAVSL